MTIIHCTGARVVQVAHQEDLLALMVDQQLHGTAGEVDSLAVVADLV